MKTKARLNQAYEKAKRLPLTDSSKFVFFSDVHRGDNSISDEFAHNQNIYFYALQDYYNKGFTYIEVGDGDELWEHSKFRDIRGAHGDVYQLISEFYKDNRFEMIFGNHNMELKHRSLVKKNLYRFFDEFLDHEDELFPGIEVHESIVLEEAETGQDILVVHGHQGDLFNDQLWWFTRFFHRHFWRYLHLIGFRNPASPAKNRIKRHKIEKNFSKWIEANQMMIIAGHTHRPKYPSSEELPYFNTGCCIHPRNITGLEITYGAISLVDWRVRPDESGALYISKKIIKGPQPVTDFLNKWQD